MGIAIQPKRESCPEVIHFISGKLLYKTKQPNTSSQKEDQLQTVQTSTVKLQKSKCRRMEGKTVYLNSVNWNQIERFLWRFSTNSICVSVLGNQKSKLNFCPWSWNRLWVPLSNRQNIHWWNGSRWSFEESEKKVLWGVGIKYVLEFIKDSF